MQIGIGSLILFAMLANPILSDQFKQKNDFVASMPGETWSVTADLRGFTIDSNGLQPDGRYYLMSHGGSGFAFSMYLEKVPGAADSTGCHDFLSDKANRAITTAKDVQLSNEGQMELLEYTIMGFKGTLVHQKNLFGCMAREDVYVDVHASKTLYKSEDELRMLALRQSVRFVESPDLTMQDVDLKSGSKYYFDGNYQMAIQQFEKVLQREKANPQLNKNTWRVLVDNLGMAYGINGDLKHARETFEYGVSKDPTYPLFYYNLACAYGEMGDLKATTDYLTRAFKNRENTIPGESMPDPRADSSFRRFTGDKQFEAFLDSLMAPAK
jgi:tetratricopeptide (TPR) repeat protein